MRLAAAARRGSLSRRLRRRGRRASPPSPPPSGRRSGHRGARAPGAGAWRLPAPRMGGALSDCCAGRGDEKRAAAKAKEGGGAAWGFLGPGAGAPGAAASDIDKFDAAYAAEDVGALVELLASRQPIGALPERLHPWAADPKTIGALAATQLAILASAARPDDPGGKVRDAIRAAGGVKALVKELAATEADRVHAATVALSFLSVDCPANCIEMFAAGAMPRLVEFLSSDVDGLKGSAAQIARNIYVLADEHRAEFKRLGGVPALVRLLDLPTGGFDPANLGLQLEATYHLQDFILGDGEELPEYVAALKAAGAAFRLEALKKVDNEELRQEADFLYLRLVD